MYCDKECALTEVREHGELEFEERVVASPDAGRRKVGDVARPAGLLQALRRGVYRREGAASDLSPPACGGSRGGGARGRAQPHNILISHFAVSHKACRSKLAPDSNGHSLRRFLKRYSTCFLRGYSSLRPRAAVMVR